MALTLDGYHSLAIATVSGVFAAYPELVLGYSGKGYGEQW
jgi:hypothetical protein